MTKRPTRRHQYVERPPFHRGAYVTQLVQATRATDWLRDNDPDFHDGLALLGSPEVGGRRGSNRSEITPAFLYHAVFGETDPAEGPTITTADGATLTVDEYEATNAEPNIDHVTQHASTAHRDRRLMSAASMVRTRYVGPCVNRGTDDEPRWQRASVTKRGALVWHDCPVACPAACKADHRHVRHQHRDAGTLYVHQTVPYGEDGLERGTVRTARTIPLVLSAVRPVTSRHAVVVTHRSPHTGRAYRHVHAVTVRTSRPIVEGTAGGERTYVTARTLSKQQGRRTRRASIGTWADAPSYRHDPERATAVDAVILPDAVAVDGHNVRVGDGLATAPATYLAERETLAPVWVRPPFVPVRVKADRAGAQPAPILSLGRSGLIARIASDPAASDLARRVLLAAEHAWTTNGQPITAEAGLSLVVLPAPGGPTLTITRGDSVVAQGTYKSRRSLVRTAVASVLA